MRNKTNNNPIKNILIKRVMIENNIKPYGYTNKHKRIIGGFIVVVALLPLCSLWLLPFGLWLLGLPLKLLVRSRIIYLKEGFKLW